jgi:hypothetical protein
VVQDTSEEFSAFCECRGNFSGDPCTALTSFACVYNESLERCEGMARALIGEGRRRPTLARELIGDVLKPFHRSIAIYLERLQQDDLIRKDLDTMAFAEIFTSSLQPVLERTIGAGGYVEHTIVLDKGDESRIAELLKEVQDRHPQVYVKSRGQTLEDGLHLTVVLSLGGSDLTIIRRDILTTEEDAISGLQVLGYAVKRIVES